jgi:hypothetical protein
LETTDAGTTITNYSTYSHPIIVPSPQPSVPAADFTVVARIYLPHPCEFGILTRVSADGASGVGLGSEVGADETPFLGAFRLTNGYSPTVDARGPLVPLIAEASYTIKLRAIGTQVWGKSWKLPDDEPTNWIGPIDAPNATDTGVGFYVYPAPTVIYDARIDDMWITVP